MAAEEGLDAQHLGVAEPLAAESRRPVGSVLGDVVVVLVLVVVVVVVVLLIVVVVVLIVVDVDVDRLEAAAQPHHGLFLFFIINHRWELTLLFLVLECGISTAFSFSFFHLFGGEQINGGLIDGWEIGTERKSGRRKTTRRRRTVEFASESTSFLFLFFFFARLILKWDPVDPVRERF